MSVTVSAVLAATLGAASCTGSSGTASAQGPVSGMDGLLATPGGVVWSFSATELSNGVLRSTDNGRHWKVVLSPSAVPGKLTASYFLGPDRAWVADQQRIAYGHGEVTTVLGTSVGGRTWWRSRPLPGDVRTCCDELADQVYFADARNGWLLASGTLSRQAAPADVSQVMRLWRTGDGGRTWMPFPPSALPLQGATWQAPGPPECGIDPPRVAFSTARDGWLTEGACGTGHARPLVWRTSDGGMRWTAAPLPAPGGGWGGWLDSAGIGTGGVSVGPPRLATSPGGRALVIVPVSTGKARVVIEESADHGRTWHVASQVHGRLGMERDSEPRDWLTVLDDRHWMLSGYGELVETTDAGRRWHFAHNPSGAAGSPASFLSPRLGFVRGSRQVIAHATSDGGRTWASLHAPAGWHSANASVLGGPVVSVQAVSPRFMVASGEVGVLVSRDGGRTWRQLAGIAVPVRRVQFFSPSHGFAVTARGALLRTADGGRTWQKASEPGGQADSLPQFWSQADGAQIASGRLYVTHDGGGTWGALAEPAGWKAGGEGSFCFARGGAGWQVASWHHRPGVLVTADGGGTWRVALPLAVHSSSPPSMIAGCSGTSAWVLDEAFMRPLCLGACGNSYPRTYDLLYSSDLGRSWFDVLRNPDLPAFSASPRPVVPASAGSLQPALFNPAQSVDFEPLALGRADSIWATTAGSMGGLGVGSSADGGLTWASRGYQLSAEMATVLPQGAGALPGGLGWLATTATDARHAWMLLGPVPLSVAGTTYLYATSDGGATWTRIATFG